MNIIEAKYKHDGLIYDLYDDGTAELVGTEKEGAIIIPETISKGDANYTVTSLNCPTLKDCKNLIRIRIPRSVIKIGNSIMGCSNLTCIEVQPGNMKFTAKDGVLFNNKLTTLILYPEGKQNKQYTIPNSVTKIGDSAFEMCESLNNIVIPNSVTNIRDKAFYLCTSLKSVVIPNSVTKIGERAFDWCESLKSVVISNSVTKIGDSAFEVCESLNNIVIPNSVTKIGERAFWGCKSLKSVVIPNSVTKIGEWAFDNCTSLKSIFIPKTVTKIGYGAFSGCKSLNNIGIEEGNPSYEQQDGVLFSKGLTTLILYPEGKQDEQYTIPNSVTNVGRTAFCECTSLKNIVIPNTVTNIAVRAFLKCSNLNNIGVEKGNPSYEQQDGVLFSKGLTTLIIYPGGKQDAQYTIPNSVTKIGEWAFADCTSLKSIFIPKTVTKIGDGAFSGCTSLNNIGIEEGNPSYEQQDGVLFSKGLTTLILYPEGRQDEQYTIPNSVTNIREWAFAFCETIKSIAFPNSMTNISCHFNSFANFNSILIPSTATLFEFISYVSSINEIICKAIVPPIFINDSHLKREIYSACTLYVPDTSLEDYKWSKYRWSNFRNILPLSKYPTKKIYTEDGIEVSDDLLSLAPGTYIIKEGLKSRKIEIG